jgi:hypothetical protein
MKPDYRKATVCWVSLALGNIIAHLMTFTTEHQMADRIIFQGIAIFIFVHFFTLENVNEI